MSVCGNCRNNICSCTLESGSSTTVVGIGTANEPFQVRPSTPAFRYVGSAYRTTDLQIILNTDTAIPFEASDPPITGGNMWSASFPTRLTTPVAGLFLVGGYAGQVQIGGGVAQNINLWISKNGVAATPQVKTTIMSQISDHALNANVMTLIRLAANDYIELYIRSNRTQFLVDEYLVGSVAGVMAHPYIFAQWLAA